MVSGKFSWPAASVGAWFQDLPHIAKFMDATKSITLNGLIIVHGIYTPYHITSYLI